MFSGGFEGRMRRAASSGSTPRRRNGKRCWPTGTAGAPGEDPVEDFSLRSEGVTRKKSGLASKGIPRFIPNPGAQ